MLLRFVPRFNRSNRSIMGKLTDKEMAESRAEHFAKGHDDAKSKKLYFAFALICVSVRPRAYL